MGEEDGGVTELVLYEAAQRALAEAASVDEVLEIHDQSVALEAYAKQAKNRDLEGQAATIRFRAQRRFGEIAAELKKAGKLRRGRPAVQNCSDEEQLVTLDSLGVDRKFSSEAQKVAAIPERQFETMLDEYVARLRDESVRVARSLLREGEKAQKREQRTQPVDGGGTVDDLWKLYEAGASFGAILVDPPWQFHTYSERGKDRNAEQHYSTMSFEEIAELPVGDLAADDCALFLWTVDWAPQEALDLISQWHFTHKSTAFTWAKTNASGKGWHMGNGYWTRSNPEQCWIATRGFPERLNADVRQLLVEPVGKHSAKPASVHGLIERLVPGPYLELFGRTPVPGWTVWGDQVEWNPASPTGCDDDADAGGGGSVTAPSSPASKTQSPSNRDVSGECPPIPEILRRTA